MKTNKVKYELRDISKVVLNLQDEVLIYLKETLQYILETKPYKRFIDEYPLYTPIYREVPTRVQNHIKKYNKYNDHKLANISDRFNRDRSKEIIGYIPNKELSHTDDNLIVNKYHSESSCCVVCKVFPYHEDILYITFEFVGQDYLKWDVSMYEELSESMNKYFNDNFIHITGTHSTININLKPINSKGFI